jgi:transcriptional regulator with XRE-family HTH domain
MKHRGEIVRFAIEKSGMNKSAVAERMGISRKALYNWFDVMTLAWDKIFEIGKIINHDFSEDFPELKRPDEIVREPDVAYSTPSTLLDCQNQLNRYKEKYINLMEENRNLWREIAHLRSGEADSASFQARAV